MSCSLGVWNMAEVTIPDKTFAGLSSPTNTSDPNLTACFGKLWILAFQWAYVDVHQALMRSMRPLDSRVVRYALLPAKLYLIFSALSPARDRLCAKRKWPPTRCVAIRIRKLKLKIVKCQMWRIILCHSFLSKCVHLSEHLSLATAFCSFYAFP